MAESRGQHDVSQLGSTLHGSSDVPALDSLTNDTYLDTYSLSVEQKKKRLKIFT